MLDYYRSAVARPEIDAYLRRAREEWSAAFYAAYRTLAKGVGAGFGVIASLLAWLERSHERRITIRELSVLDDRQLADIGLSRYDIPGIVAALPGAPTIAVPAFRARSRRNDAIEQTARSAGRAARREPANENTAAIRKVPHAA